MLSFVAGSKNIIGNRPGYCNASGAGLPAEAFAQAGNINVLFIHFIAVFMPICHGYPYYSTKPALSGGRPSVIKTVIRIKNNYVMVFDEYGEQMSVYQGHYSDVKARILSDAPAGSVFSHWFGNSLEPEHVAGDLW